MILVSACLAGVKSRYDGESTPCDKVIELVKKGEAIPVCPEQLGGLTTPRTRAEVVNGKVMTADGKDVTEQYKKGAEQVLMIAKLAGCKQAILKAKSPACGHGKIYDGTFSGKLIDGNGILADVLEKSGIEVKTEEDF